MKKTAAIQWEKLQGEGTHSNVKHFTPSQYWKTQYKANIFICFCQVALNQVIFPCYFHLYLLDQYPSSSHYTRNWDKLVGEIKEEEKNENVEGDAALNKLFQQIYSDGSDDVKRAMNKSFVSPFLSLFWCSHVVCSHFFKWKRFDKQKMASIF